MFCRKCGAEIEENAAFCTKCGERITSSVSTPELHDVDISPKKPKKTKKVAAAILGTIAAGVAAAVIILAFVDTSAQEKKKNVKGDAKQEESANQKREEGDSRLSKGGKEEPFKEQAYELTEEQKYLLQKEMGFASRHTTCLIEDWNVDMDGLSDKSIIWLALDMIKNGGNDTGGLFDGITKSSDNWEDSTVEIDADSFLAYLQGAFGREITRQEIDNLLMNLRFDEERDIFRWDGKTPEDEITVMVEPVITEARRTAENKVQISGKYTGGMEAIEEADSTFESEWEINDSSAIYGLQLKTLKLNVAEAEGSLCTSWQFKDELRLMCLAMGSTARQSSSTPGNILENDMGPLLRDLLLTNNILEKEIQGELRNSNNGEAYADFTEAELTDFFENTLGCSFSEMERSLFEDRGSGRYRLHYYSGDYGAVEVKYLGDGTVLYDGSIEVRGTYESEGSTYETVIHLRENEKSHFDGYVIDYVSMY